MRKEAGLSVQYPNGFFSSLTLEVHSPLDLGLALALVARPEVANEIQHVSVLGGVSLLGGRVHQLLQVDVITGKCIKRAGVGK